MTTPRFPPRGTPEYFAFIEEWLIKERVDNERQWRYLRETTRIVSGLNPIRIFATAGIASSSGAGSGSGSGSNPCKCSNSTIRNMVASGFSGSCFTIGAFNAANYTGPMGAVSGSCDTWKQDVPADQSKSWIVSFDGTAVTAVFAGTVTYSATTVPCSGGNWTAGTIVLSLVSNTSGCPSVPSTVSVS